MTFESANAAEEMLHLFQHKEINGKAIQMHFKNIKKIKDGDEKARSMLQVSNLPKEFTLDQVNDLFPEALTACIYSRKNKEKQ